MLNRFAWILIMLILSACGGGGGGAATPPAPPTPPPTPTVSPALTFAPAIIKERMLAGSSSNIAVTATLVRPADFASAATIHAYIVDDKGVISPYVNINRYGDNFTAILSISRTLEVGTYSGNLSVKLCRDEACSAQFPGSPVALPYEILIAPANAASFTAYPKAPLSARAPFDGAAPASVDVTVNGSGRIWQASTASRWIKLDKASGNGDGTLNVGYDLTGLQAGTYRGTVEVRSNDSITLSLPVELTVDATVHKLLPSDVSVALASTPQWSRLSRSLTIDDNLGKASRWSASSNQAWLSVTASGVSGTPGGLVLTVNPAALANDTIQYATVTLTSQQSGVAPVTPIQVSFWKGSVTPAPSQSPAQRYSHIVADPLRPLIYAHNGGAAIDVYNAYTGQRTASIANVGGTLGDMTVSTDGARLYALNPASSTVAVVDLVQRLKIADWSTAKIDPDRAGGPFLKSVRVNGNEVVLVGNGTAFIGASGKLVASTGIAAGQMSASPDGQRLFVHTPLLGYSMRTYQLDFTEADGGTLIVKAGSITGGWDNPADLAAAPDGKRVYVANGFPYNCTVYSVQGYQDNGQLAGGYAYPNNVEVGSDGRIYCGFDTYYDAFDINVYSTEGAFLKTINYMPAVARQLLISSDGLVLVSIVPNTNELRFYPVGP